MFLGTEFTEGRFTEGENVVQQLEALLATEVESTFFSQPFVTSETITRKGLSAAVGNVFVPKQLTGEVTHHCHHHANIKFTFNKGSRDKVKCIYKYAGEGVFTLEKCNHHTVGGDLVTTELTEVKPSKKVDSVTIDWLSYR